MFAISSPDEFLVNLLVQIAECMTSTAMLKFMTEILLLVTKIFESLCISSYYYDYDYEYDNSYYYCYCYYDYSTTTTTNTMTTTTTTTAE